MYKTSTVGYKQMLTDCYDTKIPLMVYGGFGIGKSMIPRQIFEQIAKDKGREFIVWEKTSNDQKNEMIENPEKYFVFCDQRIGQMDSTDLRGIPNMMDTDKLQTVPYAWVIYFTQKGADGVIFFDEINLAPPTVAGSAYQIINDRTISDRKLADDVFCMGAGNRAEDKAHIFEMPMPLHDRFAEVEIGVNVDDWTEWASANINPHLVSFINWKPNRLYHADVKKGDKPSTPRSVERASKLLADKDITDNHAFELVAIACGEAFATEFQAYAKYYSQLNWANIYKNPSTVKKFEMDKLWAVAGGMTDQFLKGVEDKVFASMMDVTLEMRPDFALVGLKMMKDGNKKKFTTQIKKCKKFQQIVKTHAKFIID
jgi:MoxR-like ATPase